MNPDLIDWLVKGILSGSIVYGVSILGKIYLSIQELNVRIAVVIEKVTNHEKRIEKLESKGE